MCVFLEIILYSGKEIYSFCIVARIAEIFFVQQIVGLNIGVKLFVEFIADVRIQVIHILYASIVTLCVACKIIAQSKVKSIVKACASLCICLDHGSEKKKVVGTVAAPFVVTCIGRNIQPTAVVVTELSAYIIFTCIILRKVCVYKQRK